jgi:purine-nucleoside phosphorylase
MYRSFTAEQYKDHLGFPADYQVDGVLCYGTLYEERMLEALGLCLDDMGIKSDVTTLPDPFLRFGRELKINDKTLWFMIGYGGAWLSEYLHWACLFGSRKNILLGSCGGLKPGMKTGDFIIPTSSYGDESSVRIYNRESAEQIPDETLSTSLMNRIQDKSSKVWRGPMVTCQAMIGETMEDVQEWSKAGYYGVEMEASTVFAVSNHFNVPSAASVYVGDNLIEERTNMDKEYLAEADTRKQNQRKQIRAGLDELLS